MKGFEDEKVPLRDDSSEMSVESVDSLMEWALREGYSHHPNKLAELFSDGK